MFWAASKTGHGWDVVLEANAREWLLPIKKDKESILPDLWLGKQVVRDFKAELADEDALGEAFEWPWT
jgi:hypothetical protein